MTALDLMSQLERLCLTSGGQTPVYLVDPVSQARWSVTVEPRIGPGGAVYCALVPVAHPVAQPVRGG